MTDSEHEKKSGLPIPPLKVVYSGRVQGVGFRWTCQRISKRHAVTGTVKNLADGTVELFADGEPDEVQRFLSEIEAKMHGNLRYIHITPAEESQTFRTFQILR